MSKKCNKCGETKELSEFGKHRAMRDGLQTHCKECRRVSNLSAEEKKKKYDSRNKWLKSEKGVENTLRERERTKAWRQSEEGRRATRMHARKSHRKGILEAAKVSDKHTYLVADGDCVKVGLFTEGRLADRLAQLQTGNPRKLKVLAIFESNIEKLCHYEFEHLNVLNEWFKFDLELVTFFTEHAV